MIFKAELLTYLKNICQVDVSMKIHHHPSSDLLHEQYLQNYAAGWLLQKERLL